MKKLIALLVSFMMALCALPAVSLGESVAARTEVLDLTAVTAPAANPAEGWSFDPQGNGGEPLLTLNSYGSQSAHSAPILLPPNSTVEVNGACYIDNAVVGMDMDVLSGSVDGYLCVRGSGALNLYANQYKGVCLNLPTGGSNENNEFLYIHGVTVNCYGMERTSSNASRLPACIYGNHAIEIKNANINTSMNGFGIRMSGYTPIGGVNEENTNELLIENSTVNIQNESANGLWNYAQGIHAVFGRVRFVNSDITINAGSNSIYSYLSLVIESGSVNLRSTPASTAASAALVKCDYLAVGDGVESLYFSTTKFPLTKVINCKKSGQSTLADGLTVQIGSFESGNFTTAQDPDNNDLPALKITGAASGDEHTVRFFGYGNELLSTVTVPHGGAAVAPEAPDPVGNGSDVYRFFGWDAELANIVSDLDVHAEYVLVGDIDLDGTVTSIDSLLILRSALGILTLEPKLLLAADTNFVDGVNAEDALLALRYALGIIPSLG